MEGQIGGVRLKIFSTEGPFYKFMIQLLDLIVLNFMWILFSIPIVTIGASTAAACSITMKMARDEEGYVARQFVKEFKRNWKQGTILWIIFAVLLYAIYLDVQILKVSEDPSFVVILMTIALVVVTIACFSFAFPLIARYENTIKNTIHNSIQITIRYIGRTFVMYFSLALIYLVLNFTEQMIIFMILFGPGAMIYTYGFFCRQIFAKIEEGDPDSVTHT